MQSTKWVTCIHILWRAVVVYCKLSAFTYQTKSYHEKEKVLSHWNLPFENLYKKLYQVAIIMLNLEIRFLWKYLLHKHHALMNTHFQSCAYLNWYWVSTGFNQILWNFCFYWIHKIMDLGYTLKKVRQTQTTYFLGEFSELNLYCQLLTKHVYSHEKKLTYTLSQVFFILKCFVASWTHPFFHVPRVIKCLFP